jgi:hypothetical protein
MADPVTSIRRLLSTGRKAALPPLKLLEMSAVAPIPGVPQVDIARYMTARQPSAVQMGFPARRRAIARDVERGLEQGADLWYHNEPVRQQFIYELGDAEGNRQFDLFASMVAGSSSSAPVRPNIRKASWYRQKALEGLLPANINSMSEAADWLAANPPPQGYSSVARNNDALWASRLLGGDMLEMAMSPGASHKILSFNQNLHGNLRPWTGDRHEGARLGVPERWNARENSWQKGALTPNEYVAAEKMMQRMADRYGIAPAELQAARWIGGADKTGVKSTDPTFSHALEATVMEQAKRMKESPEWVLRNFIRNGGLLSLPALAPQAQEE